MFDAVAAPDLPAIEVERPRKGSEGLYRLQVDGDGVLANLISPARIQANFIRDFFFVVFLVPEIALRNEDVLLGSTTRFAALGEIAGFKRNHRVVPTHKTFFETLVVCSIFGEGEEAQDIAGVEEADLVVFWATQGREEGSEEDGNQSILAIGNTELGMRDKFDLKGSVLALIVGFFVSSQGYPTEDEGS